MTVHRVIVNVTAGRVVPYSAQVIEVEPGRLYTRTGDGSLRPLDSETGYAGADLVASGWHADLCDAYGQVAEQLASQAQALNALRLIVEAKKEVAVHV